VLKSLERIGDHARLIAHHVQSMLPDVDRSDGPQATGLGDPAPASPSASTSPDESS
jgi:hypothetical protein